MSDQFDYCPFCGGCLDTGWECNQCGRDCMPLAKWWAQVGEARKEAKAAADATALKLAREDLESRLGREGHRHG